MPITTINSYRVTCDGCSESGGEWHGLERRQEATPQGWICVLWDQDKGDGHVVYCPECAEKRGYQVENHQNRQS